jgi:hypothetical protein
VITELYDRGADKGAVCILRREVRDAADGTLYCTIDQTVALRGNGGFGGEPLPKASRPEMPTRAPDLVKSVQTSPRAALIYRLSGDYNPLHSHYEVARKAGYDRPILHGLASYGTACAVVLQAFCAGDPARMKSLDLRFPASSCPATGSTSPAGRTAAGCLFEAKVGDRTVMDQGVADIA